MKRTLFAALGAVTVVGAGLATGSTALADTQSDNGQGAGHRYHYALSTADGTQTASQDQLRQRLHDGTGDNHENCDGTPGDQHQYHGSD
jgi:hypothetical protein